MPSPGQQRRPQSSPNFGNRKPARRKKPSTPGPGSYDLDASKGAMGRAGFARQAAPRYSFGTSDRFAYMGQHVSKRHSRSSSFFGRHSPGPATYNTRGKSMAQSFSFGSDINRPSAFKGSVSPGPVYYPSVTQSKTRPAAYSMGSGHTLGDATTVISPGPVYDTRERPGSGSAIVAGLPTYKFGSAKAREDYQAGAKTPGPDRYRPNLKSSKKAAPRFTMYETYNWRRKQASIKPPRSETPAAQLMHAAAGSNLPSFSFGTEDRFEEY